MTMFRLAKFNPVALYRRMRLRWQPRYVLDSDVVLAEDPMQPATSVRIFQAGEALATDMVPNEAILPVNWTARLRVWWWKWSLRRSLPAQVKARAAADAAGGYFKQFDEAELTPLANDIRPPTVYKRRPGTAERWYDFQSPVVPLRTHSPAQSRVPPVQNPWLKKED